MHPLFLIGAAAAGAYALTKKPAPPPPAEVAKAAIVARATSKARGRMSRGAPPDQAAAWGTRDVLNDYSQRARRSREASRF